MKIKNMDVLDRPREKMERFGAAHLSDVELLAILLGNGTRSLDVMSLAKKILKVINTHQLDTRLEDLLKIKGMGKAKSTLITASLEFARRRFQPKGKVIASPEDILPLIRHYAEKKQEHFITISLNGANELIDKHLISIGLIDKTLVHPREVFAESIKGRASSLIIAHNHPYGDLKPSNADLEITFNLLEAGKILKINIIDHIIFNQTKYFSFSENNLI